MQQGNTPGGALSPAPENGSFPTDRLHECDEHIRKYFECLEVNDHFAAKCRMETKGYLQCRMQRGLMTKQEMEDANVPDENAPMSDFESWRKKRKINVQVAPKVFKQR